MATAHRRGKRKAEDDAVVALDMLSQKHSRENEICFPSTKHVVLLNFFMNKDDRGETTVHSKDLERAVQSLFQFLTSDRVTMGEALRVSRTWHGL